MSTRDDQDIQTANGKTEGLQRTRVAVVTVACLLVAGLLALPPGALAHCDDGTEAHLLTIPIVGPTPSTCPYNEDVEEIVQAWNEASGDEQVFILVKDQSFHPPVVTVKSGATVTFVYADIEWAEEHDLKSSGRCANWWTDPREEPGGCIPSNPGQCFSINQDQGGDMRSLGQTYPLTFQYISQDQAILKSHGFQTGTPVGDLTGAQPFRECPPSTGYMEAETGTIPFHCSIHGGPDTDLQTMRGSIIVVE